MIICRGRLDWLSAWSPTAHLYQGEQQEGGGAPGVEHFEQMDPSVAAHGQSQQEIRSAGTKQDLNSVPRPVRPLVQDEGHECLDAAGDGGESQVYHHEEE